MALGAFITVGKFAYAAASGADAFTDATIKYAVKLAFRAAAHDQSVGAAIVEEARARVPRDTGRLINGITWRQDGDGSVVVEASAINPRDGFDYARAVEFGTGGATHADSDLFADTTGAGFSTRPGHHAATPAEPFFFPAAEEVLEDRGTSLDEIAAQAAEDEGLT